MASSDDADTGSLLSELTSRSAFTHVTEVLIVLVVVVLGLGGNLLVLSAAYRNSRLRDNMYLYIIALSVGDTILSTMALLTCYSVISGKLDYSYSFCAFWAVFNFIPGGNAVLIMCLMAVQRYIKTFKQSLYVRIYTKRNIVASILGSWTFSSILVGYATIAGRVEFHPGYSLCVFDIHSLKLPFLVCIFTWSFVFLLIAYYCYFQIWKFIRQHNHEMAHSQVTAKEIKATRILFLIVFSFTVFSAPFIVVSGVETLLGREAIPRKVYYTCANLYGLSFAANSIIYAWLNKRFQKEFLKILRIPCCSLLSDRVAPAIVNKQNDVNPVEHPNGRDQGLATMKAQDRNLIEQHDNTSPGHANQQNDIKPYLRSVTRGRWVAHDTI